MHTVDDYGPAPIDVPAAYPGTWPTGPVVVADDAVSPVTGPPETDGLTPVMAIGSNACPAQLRRKALGGPVLLTPALLRNHLVVYAGHTTGYGAVPATVTRWAGAVCEVFLTWLTDAQRTVMDATEGPRYERVVVPSDQGPVHTYRATSLLTVGPDGLPVRLAPVPARGVALPPALDQAEAAALVGPA